MFYQDNILLYFEWTLNKFVSKNIKIGIVVTIIPIFCTVDSSDLGDWDVGTRPHDGLRTRVVRYFCAQRQFPPLRCVGTYLSLC